MIYFVVFAGGFMNALYTARYILLEAIRYFSEETIGYTVMALAWIGLMLTAYWVARKLI